MDDLSVKLKEQQYGSENLIKHCIHRDRPKLFLTSSEIGEPVV